MRVDPRVVGTDNGLHSIAMKGRYSLQLHDPETERVLFHTPAVAGDMLCAAGAAVQRRRL